jgi:hypothetical protein
MNDYLDQKSFYNPYIIASQLENFEGQILEKQANLIMPIALVSVLQKTISAIETSHLTNQNIEALSINTFTVTTGHQLNLRYVFFYKKFPP